MIGRLHLIRRGNIFIISIIGFFEALILIFLTLLLYAVARAIIIMQTKIRLHKTKL